MNGPIIGVIVTLLQAAAVEASLYEVVQEGDVKKGLLYLLPHVAGAHPALETQERLNHYHDIGIFDTMRACNTNSTEYIYRELCRLRSEKLAALFVAAHLFQQLKPDSCFPDLWKDRYVKHLERTNVDWQKFSRDDCDGKIVGQHAKVLYGYHLPNPYGLFALQNSDLSICPAETRMPRGAGPLDQDAADEAYAACLEKPGSDCSDLKELRESIFQKRCAAVQQRLEAWYDVNPGAVAVMLHSQFVNMQLEHWPSGIAVRKFLPTKQLEESCSTAANKHQRQRGTEL